MSPAARKRGRWMLVLLGLVCAAPMIASYFTYYVIAEGRLDQLRHADRAAAPDPRGSAGDRRNRQDRALSLRGVWLFVMTDRSACDEACAKKLYFMRQIRVTQAGERHRLTMVAAQRCGRDAAEGAGRVPDTRRLVADPAAVAAWLPAGAGTKDSDHLYMVDPNGNLMMRFPKDPNPGKIKADVTKLLKWSSIG